MEDKERAFSSAFFFHEKGFSLLLFLERVIHLLLVLLTKGVVWLSRTTAIVNGREANSCHTRVSKLVLVLVLVLVCLA